MVVKKYLRSAPHPSMWNERAASMLASLGGDRVKRAAILKQTLSALGEIMYVWNHESQYESDS
jgi:hypothetical protein